MKTLPLLLLHRLYNQIKYCKVEFPTKKLETEFLKKKSYHDVLWTIIRKITIISLKCQ